MSHPKPAAGHVIECYSASTRCGKFLFLKEFLPAGYHNLLWKCGGTLHMVDDNRQVHSQFNGKRSKKGHKINSLTLEGKFKTNASL